MLIFKRALVLKDYVPFAFLLLQTVFIGVPNRSLRFDRCIISFVKANALGRCVCFLEQETFTPQKVLVIPRNRWLRLNMTEKLFTGMLNHNKNKTKQNKANALF